MSSELMRIVAASTQEDCREMGNLLLMLADSPRDVHWRANMREAMSRFQPEQETSMAKQVTTARLRFVGFHDALRREGLDHRSLIEGELQRRGDPRTFDQLSDELNGTVVSDVLHPNMAGHDGQQ